MTNDRRLNLREETRIKNGYFTSTYPTSQIDLTTEITGLLVEKKILPQEFAGKKADLQKLHQHVPASFREVDDYLLNPTSKNFYDTNEKFRETYFNLIRHIAKNVFDFDFIFQETTNFRFHYPSRLIDKYRGAMGVYLGHHCDSMLGHSFDEINVWVPLTNTYGSNSLHMTELNDSIDLLEELAKDLDFSEETYHTKGRDLFYQKMAKDLDYQKRVIDTCRPFPMKFGEMLFFDSRCIHAPTENVEADTRVSIDFRIIPVDTYERQQRVFKSQGRSGRTFSRGDVFYAKTAREI